MSSEKGPLVSVVIPCCNIGRYLDAAICSVQEQSYGNWEIIVVDDGSDDDETIDVLERLQGENQEVRLKRQVNQGVASARNNGIKASKGKYVVCLDADDMLESNYLLRTVNALEGDLNRRYGFVTTWYREFGNRNRSWRTGEFNVSKLLVSNTVHVASLFRRDAFEEVGGYKSPPVSGYEDWEFWVSMTEHGYEWTCIEEELFCYRSRDNSMLTGAIKKHSVLYPWLYDLHPKLFSKHSRDVILEYSNQQRELLDEFGSLGLEIADLESELARVRGDRETIRAEVALLRLEEGTFRSEEVNLRERIEWEVEVSTGLRRRLEQLEQSRTLRYTAPLRQRYAAMRERLGARERD